MKLAVFAAYLIVEIGVFVALCYSIGFAWAVLITILATFVGFLLLRRTGARVFSELRRAANGYTDSRAPLADTAVLGVSSVLLLVPGLVSTVLGILLLIPGLRRVARPAVAAFGANRILRRVEGAGVMNRFSRATVIDGEVVDTPHYGGHPDAGQGRHPLP